MGLRKVFEGSRVVVYVGSQEDVASSISSGRFRTVDNKIMEGDKEVIVIRREFFPLAPYLTGTCGGSVFSTGGGTVISNAHVAECANMLIADSGKNWVNWVRVDYPRTYPLWLLRLLTALGFDVSSRYDYAVGRTDFTGYFMPQSSEALIMTAGNCMSKSEDCLMIGTELPNYDPIPVGTEVEVNCTYWGYISRAVVIDVGSVLVNYGSGYAVLKPAYLMRPLDVSAIPGCSGSHVVPVSDSPGPDRTVVVTESVSVSIKKA